MKLSHQGILADIFWYEIPNHSKSVLLDEFVVMPNHIHGILILQNGFPPPDYFDVFEFENLNNDLNRGTVETGLALSLRCPEIMNY